MVLEEHRFGDLHLVLGQRAGLVGAEHIHAGQLLDCRQPADDCLAPREGHRAHRERHGEYGGQCDRDCRHRQYEREARDLEERFMAEQRHHDDQHHQRNGDQNEIVANSNHHLLEMAARL